MKDKSTIIITIVVIISLIIAGIGVYLYLYNGKPNNNNGGSGSGGTLVMGTSADFQPFEFYNLTTQQIVGFDIDIANEIANYRNATLDIRDLSFSGLLPGLQAGSFDFVMAGLTITEQRKNAVDFSNPYYGGNQSIVVRSGTMDITKASDLNGKTVGVQAETTGNIWVSNKSNVKPGSIIVYQKFTEALLDLKNGRLDAVVMDDAPAKAFIKANPSLGLKIGGVVETKEKFGIAVKKGNTSLLTDINLVLTELKANGKYDQLYEKWFTSVIR